MTGTATQADRTATTDSAASAEQSTQPPARNAKAEQLGDVFSRLMRVLTKAKSRMSPLTPGVEPSAYPTLALLTREGPIRASGIAERLHADISTISRQTSALVQAGLIERQADPNDGRACLLALTDAGHEAHEHVRAVRNEWLAKTLANWSDEDIDQLVTLLGRLSDDVVHQLAVVDAAHPTQYEPEETA